MAVNPLLPGTRSRGLTPWSSPLTLAASGQGCPGLFELYDSLGDKTLTGANTISTLLDGPEKVVRYGALTIGDGTTVSSLTAANRCKGLVVLCDTLTVRNNATLNMTGRGARVDRADDPFFPFADFKIPFRVTLSSDMVTLAKALAIIKAKGLAPWDQGTWQAIVSSLYGFDLADSQAGSVALMTASGCGDTTVGRATNGPGSTGVAGANGGTGGGGTGGNWMYAGTQIVGKSGKGNPYSGGVGSGGNGSSTSNLTGTNGSKYSGPGGPGGGVPWGNPGPIWPDEASSNGVGGGGAGNPGGSPGGQGGSAGGNGTGGKLVIIARISVTVQSGGKIEANGMPGGSGVSWSGGGGSGGGHISIITPSYSNAGTVQCAGGVGGVGGAATYDGGAGGAGSVVLKTFVDMGW